MMGAVAKKEFQSPQPTARIPAQVGGDRKTRSYFDPSLNARVANVRQGGFIVGQSPDLVLSTVLGSCVAACVYDPVRKIGGMNHFLLPGDGENMGTSYPEPSRALLYGCYAMEMLINEVFKLGADPRQLKVKLFGGAKVVANLSDIGAFNARFALDFVKNERLELVSSDLLGVSARRIRFWPTTGRVQVCNIPQSNLTGKAREETRLGRQDAAATKNSVEIF